MDTKRIEELDELTQKAYEEIKNATTSDEKEEALERYELLFKMQEMHFKNEAEAYNLDETRRLQEDKNAVDAQMAEQKQLLEEKKADEEKRDRKRQNWIEIGKIFATAAVTIIGAVLADYFKSRRQKAVLDYEREDIINTKAFDRP